MKTLLLSAVLLAAGFIPTDIKAQNPSPQLPEATPGTVRPPAGQEEAPNESHVAPEAAATPHTAIPDTPAKPSRIVGPKDGEFDRQTTARIRKSIVAEKSFSSEAHNVKILTHRGIVTLKGQVRSDDERDSIRAKAAEAAGGSDKVVDQLSVRQERTEVR